MTLHIKYMVSRLCEIVVQAELEKLGLHPVHIETGEVEILDDITPSQREQLKVNLIQAGLELMEDKKNILPEKIKELLLNNKLNLNEIYCRLHYSGLSHLPVQSGKIPELSPCFFRNTNQKHKYTPENLFINV
jgi:hypothetical protein